MRAVCAGVCVTTLLKFLPIILIVRHSRHPSLGAETFLILAIGEIRSFMPYFQLASILKFFVEVYQSNDYFSTQINNSHTHAKGVHAYYPALTAVVKVIPSGLIRRLLLTRNIDFARHYDSPIPSLL